MTGSDDRRRVVAIARPGLDETQRLVDALGDSIDVRVVETETPDDVEQAVVDAVRDGAEAIASVGGDGALNLVADAVVRNGFDIAVAPVPAGTVNLTAHLLDVATLERAADAISTRSTVTMDVGETPHGVFVINASSGYDAAVIDDAHDHSDSVLGRVRFLVAGVRRLRRDRPVPVRVTVDGRNVFDAPAMSVIVMNVGERGSERFHVAPDAEFDDGRLDVLVLRTDSAPRIAGLVWRLARRFGLPDRDAVRAQGQEIRVQWARPVPSQRDGDPDAELRSTTVRIRPSALRIHGR